MVCCCERPASDGRLVGVVLGADVLRQHILGVGHELGAQPLHKLAADAHVAAADATVAQLWPVLVQENLYNLNW